MEIRPNFSNSGKCYLIGLAVTMTGKLPAPEH